MISLEPLVCGFEHEDGVGDLEGGPQLDAHYLHDVGLGEQQQSFPVNHLEKQGAEVDDRFCLLTVESCASLCIFIIWWSHLLFEETSLFFTANQILDEPEDLQRSTEDNPNDQNRDSNDSMKRKVSCNVCRPHRHSMLPPGWHGCPERPGAAYSAAPSRETESGRTDRSEPT